jgi:hypothetical protein
METAWVYHFNPFQFKNKHNKGNLQCDDRDGVKVNKQTITTINNNSINKSNNPEIIVLIRIVTCIIISRIYTIISCRLKIITLQFFTCRSFLNFSLKLQQLIQTTFKYLEYNLSISTTINGSNLLIKFTYGGVRF